MIVCVCNQVSDRTIACCIKAGMDFSDIQLELGVATCCGCCESFARQLVCEYGAQETGITPGLASRQAETPAIGHAASQLTPA